MLLPPASNGNLETTEEKAQCLQRAELKGIHSSLALQDPDGTLSQDEDGHT